MTELHYESKAEYINKSEHAKYLSLPVREQLMAMTVKRKGVYTLRRTAPKPSQEPQLAVWLAMKTATHLANWGDLNSWGDGQTARLMMMSPENRALFETAFDEISTALKAKHGPRYGRNWSA